MVEALRASRGCRCRGTVDGDELDHHHLGRLAADGCEGDDMASPGEVGLPHVEGGLRLQRALLVTLLSPPPLRVHWPVAQPEHDPPEPPVDREAARLAGSSMKLMGPQSDKEREALGWPPRPRGETAVLRRWVLSGRVPTRAAVRLRQLRSSGVVAPRSGGGRVVRRRVRAGARAPARPDDPPLARPPRSRRGGRWL